MVKKYLDVLICLRFLLFVVMLFALKHLPNHGTLIRYIYYLLFFPKRSECVPVFVINSTSSRSFWSRQKSVRSDVALPVAFILPVKQVPVPHVPSFTNGSDIPVLIMTFIFLNSLQGHASCRCLDDPDNLSF